MSNSILNLFRNKIYPVISVVHTVAVFNFLYSVILLFSRSIDRLFAGALVLLTLLLLAPLSAFSNINPSIKQEELAKLRQHISGLKVELEEVRDQRDSQRQALQKLEVEIAKVDREILRSDKLIKANKGELNGLQKRQSKALGELEQQRTKFSKLVKATYMMGYQDYTKMLLSQKDPSKISRMLEYYKYLAKIRVDRIEGFRNSLVKLGQLEKKIKQNTVELAALAQTQKHNRQNLQAHHGSRELIVKELATEIITKAEQIKSLRKDEERLLKLIEQLNKYTIQQRLSVNPVEPFGQMKGKLSLPVSAKIVARFGQIQQPSGIRWQGILMEAPQDKPVKAIFTGRVIFADWFRGFGLLLIVDHGEGYMSLYSHNKHLFKQLGDWVNRGELIAGVGNSGGLAKPGLYFEIRHNGVPDDPLRWCRNELPN